MASVKHQLWAVAPTLSTAVEKLSAQWLQSLTDKLESDTRWDFRPKQFNDPIWGTIELLPWEVAILDTLFMQRMRNVRQLGLAQLVFPSAGHDRFEHLIGAVGAVEEMMRALTRQIARWNRDRKDDPLPDIVPSERYAVRLAALFHDIGHGPFSHALEPVLHTASPLDANDRGEWRDERNWRAELTLLQKEIRTLYVLNKPPSISEIIAVMLVLSASMTSILANDRLMMDRGYSAQDLQETIVAAIVGGVEGPGASHLSALISSQIDSDKLDYLARDAHHAGLEIGFDTNRLLAKLEILKVRSENLDHSVPELRHRAQQAPNQTFHQIGIAASGFGSFEQMLIGRTFLYDRLYHHHKVRVAEAMAQRLILVAERDRRRRFDFSELFLAISDDAFMNVLAGDLTHVEIEIVKGQSRSLARRVLDRDLLHRAFAFRGTFVASPPGFSQEAHEKNRAAHWRRLVKELSNLTARYRVGVEIFDVARLCARALVAAKVDETKANAWLTTLDETGPEQIIVDLPERKADSIKILARYPNGALKVPEFSFNPVKWADAYDLQKRTGYVFCLREIVPIVSVAAKIVFLKRYGVTMSKEADGYIKVTQPLTDAWLRAVIAAGVIDDQARDFLTTKRHSLIKALPEDLCIPDAWLKNNPDFAVGLANNLNDCLQGGLAADDFAALQRTLKTLWALVDHWHAAGSVTSEISNEREFQKYVRQHLEAAGLQVHEKMRASGGEIDLFVENTVLIENKFDGKVGDPATSAPDAGAQGRRYAIALDSQIVIVLNAYRHDADNPLPDKIQSVRIVNGKDGNRAEVRMDFPFAAVMPSSERKPKFATSSAPRKPSRKRRE